jgi:hypothetical protein
MPKRRPSKLAIDTGIPPVWLRLSPAARAAAVGRRKRLHCADEQRCGRADRDENCVPGERQRRVERCRVSAAAGDPGVACATRCAGATSRRGTVRGYGADAGRGAAATLLRVPGLTGSPGLNREPMAERGPRAEGGPKGSGRGSRGRAKEPRPGQGARALPWARMAAWRPAPCRPRTFAVHKRSRNAGIRGV